MSRSHIVLRAVAWFLLAGFCLEFFALALPLVAPNYSRNSFSWNKAHRHSLDSSIVARIPQILTASDISKRDITEDHRIHEDAYRKMNGCYQDLLVSSLSLCMPQPSGKRSLPDFALARLSDDSPGFEDALVDGLRLYHSNLLCISSELDYFGRDRGLAYYDRNSDIETLIKELINVHKDTLSYLSDLVDRIPGIGPVIGPVVYDIKCLLDKLLDAVENISDVFINAIHPLLALCSQDTLKVACKSGLSLLGICI